MAMSFISSDSEDLVSSFEFIALLTSAISGLFIFPFIVFWLQSLDLFIYLFIYFPIYLLNLPGVEISFYYSDYPDVVTLEHSVFCWIIHIVLNCSVFSFISRIFTACCLVFHIPGEGNGNPFQYSCLRNPMDRGDWWATVYRVTKSLTWLNDETKQQPGVEVATSIVNIFNEQE